MVQSCCHFQVVMLHMLASLCSPPFLRTVGTVIHNEMGQIGEKRDWDDYNYAPPGGGAGCRQGAVMRDPLTELCDDLSGFEAEDITALLCDLPIPRPGDVPGMTVEEAIKV